MQTKLYHFIVEKKHHQFRRSFPEYEDLAEKFSREQLPPLERITRRFELLTSLETPVLLPDEKICFLRTVTTFPDCFTPEE